MKAWVRCSVWMMLLVLGQVRAATVLSLGYVAAPEHPRARACAFFAEAVKTASHGRILIDLLSGGSLGDDGAMVRALQNGSLDLSANSQGPVAAVVPEYNAFGLPFLFADSAQACRLLDGPIGRELARRSAAKGLVVLGFWDNGLRHVSNSVRPIRVPADLAGLRIRTPAHSLSADILAALGAKPRELNFSDLYNALQQDVVDGQENPLVNFQEIKLYQVQKYISLTGHNFHMTPFLISRGSWEALPAADQAILQSAADQATRYQRALTAKAEQDAYADLLARGVRINRVASKPFIAATAKVYEQWYAGPIGAFARSVVQAARAQP